MPVLSISPHGGLNKRFPINRLANNKTQKVRELKNLISLDGVIKKFPGAERYDASELMDPIRWGKRIYYKISGDDRRSMFISSGRKMYRGNITDKKIEQVTINNSLQTLMKAGDYLSTTTMKVAGVITTFLADGKDLYKFTPNETGNWEKLATIQDIDGNNIEFEDIIEYQDRLWAIPKGKNVILHSKNLNPENFSDANDSGLLELPPGNGGFPRKFFKLRGFLFVMHEDYFTPVSGSSAATYGVPPGNVIEGFGTRARASVVNMENSVAFLNSEDNQIYITGGTLDSTKIWSYEIDFKNLVNVNMADKTVGIFHDDLLRFSYVPSGEEKLNAEIIYSFNEEKWCGESLDRHVNWYIPWTGKGDKGELLFGRSDIGVVMKEGVGLNYDSAPISYRLVTASYELDSVRDCRVEYFWIEADPGGAYTVPFRYLMDAQITTNGVEQINMQGETISLGLITIKDQEIFINRAIPKWNRSKGRLIQFICEEEVLDRLFELQSIYVKFNKQNPKVTKRIVGV